MKALVGAFNQEKALVGAFSVIVQPVVVPYTALVVTSITYTDIIITVDIQWIVEGDISQVQI